MPVVEAKAKVRARHEEAIAEFKKWKRKNPHARTREQVRMFDFLVDSARLKEMMK